jgi:RNase P subunit RPR2
MKTLNPKQKIVLQRIYRLFELASEMNDSKNEDKETYVKRYLSLAKKLGERVNVSIPKELQKHYCKKCFSMNITSKKETPLLIINCNECKFVKKFGLE